MTLSNKLTFLRILLIPFFMVAMELSLGLWPVILFSLAALTDFFDGYLARKRNEITTLGKFLDPLADKLLTMTAFLYLLDVGILPAWALVIILGRETAVTGLRVLAAKDGLVMAASIWGKVKTSTQMVSLVILLLSFALTLAPWIFTLAMLLFYLSLAAAIFSGYDYFKKAGHLLKH